MRKSLTSFLVMLAAGWLAAGTPFRGDQALFTLHAQRMAGGDVLYRDLWEVTNPGVLWFYQAAGTLFGFTEDGIHFAEWLWFTAFVLLLVRITNGVAPAYFVGAWYYATSCADPSHLTKAEGLAAFPLFVAIRAAGKRRSGWLVLAGFAGGLAVLFKLAFALCLVCGWLALAIAVRPGRRWLLVLAGFLTMLLTATGYFAWHGALGNAIESLFITPRELAASAEPAGFARLAGSLRWFVETATPLLALAVAGSLLMRRDPLARAYWAMIPAALAVILVQRWSWWTYHFLLLALPLAVLASITWPSLWAWLGAKLPSKRERLAALTVIGLLFLAPLSHGALAALRLLPHRLGLADADRRAARLNTGNAYRIALEETAWLPEGAIFVAGDPTFHFLSGRPMATRIHGWSLEILSPRIWAELLGELQARPPRFIYVSREYETLIPAKSPAFQRWLAGNYQIARASENGVWYENVSP